MERALMIAGGYGLVLLAIHLVATRGTGALPAGLHDQVGASAGTVISRAWAQWTALWFHNSWGHITYNLFVMMATMSVAIHYFGPKALLVALIISPLAGYAINLLFILPLATFWGYAQSAVEPRLVGASIAIFAGAGMAWVAWNGPPIWKGLALVAFVVYEAAFAFANVTNPFVCGYHMMGGAMGIGAGLAMKT